MAKPMNEEEKFKDYVRKTFEEINHTQRSFSLNLGSIARELGMNPKTFVKALYADEKNKAFYMKTLIYEQDYSMKMKNKKDGFFKSLISKFKPNDKRQQPSGEQANNPAGNQGNSTNPGAVGQSSEEGGKTSEASS